MSNLTRTTLESSESFLARGNLSVINGESIITTGEVTNERKKEVLEKEVGDCLFAKGFAKEHIESAENKSTNHRWGAQVITCLDITIGPKIGEGTFAEVFWAWWNGRGVALKKFKAVFNSECIRKEVTNAMAVSHSNIVQALGILDEKEGHMLVMELMHCSLRDLLGGKLGRQDVIHIALDVAEGLNYFHSLTPKIIHRDLKPENILLDVNGRAKLSDFGTARRLDNDTKASSVVGTLNFMAPEVMDELPYDEKADIYSFGAVIFEMLTGERLPRQMEKRAEKIEAIADTELRQLVVLCCTNDPTQRPDIQKCISILEDLERATSISASN